MIVVFGIIGVATILYIAMQGGGDAPPAPPVPDTAGIASDPTSVPDAVGASVPSNVGDANTGDNVESDFMPGVSSPINPLDQNTWPGGDRIWDVARAIAQQEGYGVSLVNAPTRNNNPGDISDGFAQFGGELLDSKITKFPDPQTGWNWLYNKLKRVHDGMSSVYSNSMTWGQFGHVYAADPNWTNGVTRTLGVAINSRVGDYWNA